MFATNMEGSANRSVALRGVGDWQVDLSTITRTSVADSCMSGDLCLKVVSGAPRAAC
jgi:hypothetical protein